MILGTLADTLINDLHLLMRSPFMIGEQMRKLANTNQSLVPASVPVGNNTPLLKRGSRGDAVKKLQSLLNKAGAVPALPMTVNFGKTTQNAVMKFQIQYKIEPVDGVVGPKTWSTLERVSGQSVSVPLVSFPSAVVCAKLAELVPSKVISALPSAVNDYYEINNSLRLAHFLAQCAVESSFGKTPAFMATTEEMTYTTPSRLVAMFSNFTQEKADEYVGQPEKIGNLAYANELGNGDEKSGDGYKYRGRGYIHITGRAAYATFGERIGDNILNNPDLVATKYPMESAAWWWDSNSMNEIADKGATNDNVTAVTRKVNPALLNLNDRINWFKKFWSILA